MLELLNSHHVYCKSENSKIRLAVHKAEDEWNIRYAPAQERTTRNSKKKEVLITTVIPDDLPSTDAVSLEEPSVDVVKEVDALQEQSDALHDEDKETSENVVTDDVTNVIDTRVVEDTKKAAAPKEASDDLPAAERTKEAADITGMQEVLKEVVDQVVDINGM
jgi:hypothetical protein